MAYVFIDGEKYQFVLDSGAPNVISKELANKLGLKSLQTRGVSDIHGNISNMDYTMVKDITIGSVVFYNNGVIILDFENDVELSCFKVDGLIGANLMGHSVWDIDFDDNQITITSSEGQVHLGNNYFESRFYVGTGGLPSVKLFVNDEKLLNNLIDLEYAGNIRLLNEDFFGLKEKGKVSNYTEGYGHTVSGAFGYGEKKVFYESVLDSVGFGNLVAQNTDVLFNPTGSRVIGLGYLKKSATI